MFYMKKQELNLFAENIPEKITTYCDIDGRDMVFSGRISTINDKHTLKFCFDCGGEMYFHFNKPLNDEDVKQIMGKAVILKCRTGMQK